MASIHDVVEAGDVVQVTELLDSDPALLEERNVLNDTPLHVAAQQGHQNIVDLLLRKGSDVNALGNQDYTPLHYATQEDLPDLALLLIEHGADVEKKNRQGATPLQVACWTSPRVAEILIDHGAKVDLNCAIRLKDIKAIRRLLKSKKSLAAVASFPNQLLEDGMLSRNKEIFDLLLNYNRHPIPLELSRADSLLFRAIEQAMSDSDPAFLRELLEHGAATNVANQRGESPLKFLSNFRTGVQSQADVKQELARLLKEHGAQE